LAGRRCALALCAALIFQPLEAGAGAPAFSSQALTAAIDAALTSEMQASGDRHVQAASGEGGMITPQRPEKQVNAFGLDQRIAEIDALLAAPVHMETRYERFRVFDVSAPQVESPPAPRSVPKNNIIILQPVTNESAPDAARVAPGQEEPLPEQQDGNRLDLATGNLPEEEIARGGYLGVIRNESWLKSSIAALLGVLMVRAARRPTAAKRPTDNEGHLHQQRTDARDQ
jgi:hypothetical protein